MRTTERLSHTETPLPRADPAEIRAIREKIADAASSGADGPGRGQRSVGDDGWQLALTPGLHEWFDGADSGQDGGSRGSGRGPGHAEETPTGLSIMIGLAWRAIDQAGGRVFWIGKRCWPYPPALIQHASSGRGDSPNFALLDRSVFIDTRCRDELVWAIDVVARGGAGRRDAGRGGRGSGTALVIADGSGLTMAESRRLHLAAREHTSRVAAHDDPEEHGTAICLLRPCAERTSLSAAATRWSVTPIPPVLSVLPAISGSLGLPNASADHGAAGPGLDGECRTERRIEQNITAANEQPAAHHHVQWGRRALDRALRGAGLRLGLGLGRDQEVEEGVRGTGGIGGGGGMGGAESMEGESGFGDRRQGWTAELLRCKGLRPADWGARRWLVRRDHATGTFDTWTREQHNADRHTTQRPPGDGDLPAELAGRSGAPIRQTGTPPNDDQALPAAARSA